MAIDLHPKNELQWFKEGRVFQALHGVLSTGVIFETDLVRRTPDLLVRVPGGTVIVPLRVTVSWEVTGNDVAQCLISSCDNDPGTSNMTQFTPVNLNTRFADETGSKVTAFVTSTSTGVPTEPTNLCDLYRMYIQTDIDAITGFAHFEQAVYSPLHGKGLPAIIGSSGTQTNAFMVYPAQGANGSPTGYVIANWAEFTFDEFYAE